mgnify:CR=1 FL=1
MKKFLIILLIIVILISTCLLYSRFIATSGLKVKEYKVVNDKIIDEYHGLKIVHLSDIHFGSTITENDLDHLVNKVNELNPDIVVITGDIIDERISYDKNILIDYLKKIQSKLGKFAISGNHDLPLDDFNSIVEESGFTNLDNTYKLIYANSSKPIIISGISSNYSDSSNIDTKTAKFDNYIANLTDDIKPIYSILLIHEPDFIDSLNIDNYDLILAGHSHGGQVKLPLIKKLYTPYGAKKYYDEYYKVNQTDLYISSGLGTSKLKFRLFNRPSINFYRITNK